MISSRKAHYKIKAGSVQTVASNSNMEAHRWKKKNTRDLHNYLKAVMVESPPDSLLLSETTFYRWDTHRLEEKYEALND